MLSISSFYERWTIRFCAFHSLRTITRFPTLFQQGHGEHHWPSGHYDVGGWDQGLRHGPTTYFHANGSKEEATYIEGYENGPSTVEFVRWEAENKRKMKEWIMDMTEQKTEIAMKNGEADGKVDESRFRTYNSWCRNWCVQNVLGRAVTPCSKVKFSGTCD